MHSFHYRDGRLYCEEVDLAKAAEAFGTPLYIYSAGTILDHYQRLDQALAGLDHLICYAVKANSNRAILHLLAEAGAGFDIVSGGELYRVIRAGGDASKCTFAGVGKSREEIEYALEQQVYSFNIESEAELDYINQIAVAKNLRAAIALRVNPDVVAPTHKYIATGQSENKFGVPLDRVATVYERAAKMPNIIIRGIQMHIGSQITEAAPFVAAIETITPLVGKLKSRYPLEFFSIGGGLGIAYESSIASGRADWWAANRSHPLTISDYANAIVPQLEKMGLRILLEPGRLLVGNAGVLLTRVRYIKETGQKKFAIVDAGMNDLIRPALYGSYHEIVPVKESHASTSKIDIVGPVCESGDFFAQERDMPPLQAGDLLAIMSAGAYGFAMASTYNSRPLPAEALVRGDKVALVRERQVLEDLTRGEVDPKWQQRRP
ncbi:MAG: diaminopimelate decarboxylase [Verrucomicrobia bacterium]|nr:MAG: diaminopimelate decarboxylase [Verrucomicrobiota bacterium]